MANRNNILNELDQLKSDLAHWEVQNAYQVPIGYFEEFSTQMLTLIKALDSSTTSEELEVLSPLLAGLPKQNPFSVPEGYFEGLENNIINTINKPETDLSVDEELESISPLLGSLNKSVPYTVPIGYFDSLTGELKQVSKPKNVAKIIPFRPIKWTRYATAAIIIGIVAVTGILYFHNQNSKPIEANKAWSKVEKKVEKLSDKEIKDFVQFTDAGLNGTEMVTNKPSATEEVKELLKDISNKELQEFLDQTADTEEDILQIN